MTAQIKEVVTINLNAEVMIQLTDAGKQWYCDQEARFGIDRVLSEHRLSNKDQNGWYKFMLWEFMEIFGPALHAGVMNPRLFASDLRVVR